MTIMAYPFAYELIILAAGWALFGFLHSLMAAVWFKRSMQQTWGRFYKYYRFAYSLFSLLVLSGILAYQFSLPALELWRLPKTVSMLFIIPVTAGLIIMLLAARKYFITVTGINVFSKQKQPESLQQGGLHRYMRHPLYAGTLLMAWSLFFIFPFANNLVGCVMLTLYTLIGIRLEERKLIAVYGSAYLAYRQRVPTLVPFRISFKKYLLSAARKYRQV